MLLKLLRRDVLLHGRMLLISYAIFLAFEAYFALRVSSARFWLTTAAIYAAFRSITVFAREDKFGSSAWTCTLPVRRAEVVRARFVIAWLLVAAALATGAAMAALLPGTRVVLPEIVLPATLLCAATAVTLIVALMLPFLIRFGLLGIMIFLVGAQMLGAGVLALAMVLGRRGRHVSVGFSSIAHAVRSAYEAFPPTISIVLAVALLFAINWAGYRLSVFLFRRRDF
jgi:hypothetical protein